MAGKLETIVLIGWAIVAAMFSYALSYVLAMIAPNIGVIAGAGRWMISIGMYAFGVVVLYLLLGLLQQMAVMDFPKILEEAVPVKMFLLLLMSVGIVFAFKTIGMFSPTAAAILLP